MGRAHEGETGGKGGVSNLSILHVGGGEIVFLRREGVIIVLHSVARA